MLALACARLPPSLCRETRRALRTNHCRIAPNPLRSTVSRNVRSLRRMSTTELVAVRSFVPRFGSWISFRSYSTSESPAGGVLNPASKGSRAVDVADDDVVLDRASTEEEWETLKALDDAFSEAETSTETERTSDAHQDTSPGTRRRKKHRMTLRQYKLLTEAKRVACPPNLKQELFLEAARSNDSFVAEIFPALTWQKQAQWQEYLLSLARQGATKLLFEATYELMNTMPRWMDHNLLNAILRIFRENNNLIAAHSMFVLAGEKGQKADAHTIGIMCELLCRHGHVKRAFEILNDADARGQSIGITVYNGMLKHLVPLGNFDDVKALMVRMFKSENVPDSVTMNMLIPHYVVTANLPGLIGVLTMMHDLGVGPDKFTASLLLRFCAQHGLTDLATQLWQLFAANMEMDSACYNAYLMCFSGLCGDTLDVQTARSVYQDMLAAECAPDEYTYRSLMLTAARAKDVELAGYTMDEMFTRQINPTLDVYLGLLQLYMDLDQPMRVAHILRKVERIPFDRRVLSFVQYAQDHGLHVGPNLLALKARLVEFPDTCDSSGPMSPEDDVDTDLARKLYESLSPSRQTTLVQHLRSVTDKFPRFLTASEVDAFNFFETEDSRDE